MHEILLVCGLALLAYTAKGITGAASAVVFNAGLLLALAFGFAGAFTLEDGLAWSLTISRKNGRAVLSASGDGIAYVVFGTCSPAGN